MCRFSILHIQNSIYCNGFSWYQRKVLKATAKPTAPRLHDLLLSNPRPLEEEPLTRECESVVLDSRGFGGVILVVSFSRWSLWSRFGARLCLWWQLCRPPVFPVKAFSCYCYFLFSPPPFFPQEAGELNFERDVQNCQNLVDFVLVHNSCYDFG